MTSCVHHAVVMIIAREENIHSSEGIGCLYQGEETGEKSMILAGILPSNLFLSTESV